MGTTGCHLPCFVLEDTTKWQVFFYHDVAPHQQRRCQKNAELRRTCCSQSVLQCTSNRLTWLLATFYGAAWHRQSGSNSRFISSVEEAFVNTNLPLPPGPTPLWGPRGVPGEWSDVCGFLKPPGSEDDWQIRNHGAFTIPYSTLGLKEKDQSCHHEFWNPPPPRQCETGRSGIPGRQTSSTSLAEEELAVRPQQM